MKIKITYKGDFNEDLDKELEKKLVGWKREGSGYNFIEKERDMEFTKKNFLMKI